MKTLYKLPSGKLGPFNEINLETVMNVSHFDTLALLSDDDAERGVLAVLKDLMEEDPFKLSMRDLYYVFLLVKVSSFGPEIPVSVTCRNFIKDPETNARSVCNHINQTTFSLADADIEYAPSDMEIPSVILHGKSFLIKPPSMADELDLIAYYQEKGISRQQLANVIDNKDQVIEYARHRMFLYLRDFDTGEAVYSDRDRREKALAEFKSLPITVYKDITSGIDKVDKFGVKSQTHQVVCKGCNNTVTFRTGLLAGLTL